MLARRALFGAAAAALAGCAAPAPGRSASGPPAVRLTAALAAALRTGDRDGFVGLAAAPLRTRAGALFDAWRALASVELADAAGGPYPHGLVVRWRVGSERHPVEHLLGVVVEGNLLGDLRDDLTPAPIWSRRPVTVAGEGGAWVVSARAGQDAADWLPATTAALARVRSASLEPWASSWDGALVVEVPADDLAFGRMVGDRSAASTLAAVTSAPAADRGTRVVVNPGSAEGWGADDRVGVLTHEAVHAVMASPRLRAPLWALEGIAESVATATWPAQARVNDALVAEARASGAALLPGPDAFAAGGRELATAYALAEVAVEAAFDLWGRATVLGWMADWESTDRPPDAEVAAVLGAALSRG